jgi:SAM-dependent methyltransferase
VKRCLTCNHHFDSARSSCPECGFKPEQINGFEAYASEYADQGGGFKAGYFAELAQNEASHFWFEKRNKLILWALEKYCPNFQSFLEIGCGTGFVLSSVAQQYPSSQLFGSEIFVSGLGFAAERLPDVKLMQMDARKIPFGSEFDVIGAFDVIEHIEEDELVLSQLQAALKPGGYLLLTVPQHAWLWSPVDDYACHQRRYGASELHRKVESAGFEKTRSTSFISSLLPAMIASRIYQNLRPRTKFDASAEFRMSPWLNRLFSGLLDIELAMIRLGINFPLGGSRLMVARKPIKGKCENER